VTQESIDDLHTRFYQGIKKLWDETRHMHEGYAGHVLEFDGAVH
jgi:hypothetical protein